VKDSSSQRARETRTHRVTVCYHADIKVITDAIGARASDYELVQRFVEHICNELRLALLGF
jgi:hypothetical protein